jgi:signal transduction histidine kinase
VSTPANDAFERQRAPIVRTRFRVFALVFGVYAVTYYVALERHVNAPIPPLALRLENVGLALGLWVFSRKERPLRQLELGVLAALLVLSVDHVLRLSPLTMPNDPRWTTGIFLVASLPCAVFLMVSWQTTAAAYATSLIALVVAASWGHSELIAPVLQIFCIPAALLVAHVRTRDRLERSELAARAALAEANERLRRSEEARSRLFVNLSHDFRTPLAVIRGEAELARAGAPPSLDAALDRIQKNATFVTELTEQLLELAQLDAGKTPCSRGPVDVASITREVAAQLQPARGEATVRAVHVGSPAYALADAAHVKRILTNLVANGLRQLRKRDGEVCIAVTTIAPETVDVEVTDDGAGVPPERRAALFERFVSFDVAGSVASGIGLPLARELAELNGGSLDLLDDRPKTTLRLRLQAANPPQEAAGAARGVPVGGLGEPGVTTGDGAPGAREANLGRDERGATLLVVEDHAEMRDLLCRLLAGRFDVRTAASLSEGLRELRRGSLDSVLCDVMLPDGDGYDLLRHVRSERSLEDLPVIFVSAMGEPADHARGLAAGADDYIAKPFSGEELKARIATGLARVARRRRALREQREAFLAELHDGVTATLARASLLLTSDDGAVAAGRLADAVAAIDEGLAEAHGMMDLVDASDASWEAVVAEVRRETADACERAELTLDFRTATDGTRPRLSPEERHTIRRVAREALTNILKHAQAGRVTCVLATRAGAVDLRIEDDGRGMRAGTSAGRGLGILATRVARLGGHTRFAGGAAAGVLVEAHFPARALIGA